MHIVWLNTLAQDVVLIQCHFNIIVSVFYLKALPVVLNALRICGVESKQMSCEKLHCRFAQLVGTIHTAQVHTVARFLINKDAHTRIPTKRTPSHVVYKNKFI